MKKKLKKEHNLVIVENATAALEFRGDVQEKLISDEVSAELKD